jgi:hypothetical protein
MSVAQKKNYPSVLKANFTRVSLTYIVPTKKICPLLLIQSYAALLRIQEKKSLSYSIRTIYPIVLECHRIGVLTWTML